MFKKVYEIVIEIKTPFIISSGNIEGEMIDKATVKMNNKPFIPGSTLKGKVRDNLLMILKSKLNEDKAEELVSRLFGSKGYCPSKIYFTDLLPEEEKGTNVRYGVAIDRFRKVSKDKALYSFETADIGIYKGKVEAYIDEEIDLEELIMAFKMIDFIGGSKSRGCGRCKVDIREVKA